MTKRFSVFAVIVGVALVIRLAIMATAPVFEPSEARYAAISANMARCGNWFVPQFTYEGVYQTFAGKPPLVFQAAGACCRLFGVNEFAVRLPSLLAFALLLAIVYRTVLSGTDSRTAWIATGMTATSTALYATAGFCMTDGVLVCCVSGALLLYWRLCSLYGRKARSATALAIGILLALGVMAKGPVAMALFGLPVVIDFALNRRRDKRLRLDGLLAVCIFLLAVVPYFWLTESAQPGFLEYFLWNENVMRFLTQDYGDRYGAGRETFRGMSLVWTWVVMLPWSLLLVFRRGRCTWKASMLAGNFPLLAAATIALFWCLTSRVPIAYLLPVVPLLSVALAVGGDRFGIARERMAMLLPWSALVTMAVVVATLVAVRLSKPKKLPGASAPPKISDHYFSHEFYHGPWGEGAPKK